MGIQYASQGSDLVMTFKTTRLGVTTTAMDMPKKNHLSDGYEDRLSVYKPYWPGLEVSDATFRYIRVPDCVFVKLRTE